MCMNTPYNPARSYTDANDPIETLVHTYDTWSSPLAAVTDTGLPNYQKDGIVVPLRK
jgi:hypothetical protein